MSTRCCPALFLAAPASGQGKTTVTAALARHHRDLGRRVRVFKTGPDFLDPMILERASGAPVYQLDLWMGGEAHCRQLLYQAAGAADLILIEGVMGLFDGESSSADQAIRLGIPVLAIIDASHMAQTFGALAHGLATYRPGLPFAGVFANRVAGERHYQMLAESLPTGLAAYGWLPRDAGIALPSRHLGLVQAAQIADLEGRLDQAAAGLRLRDPALPAAVTFCPVVAPKPVNTFPASADPPPPNSLPRGKGELSEWLVPDASSNPLPRGSKYSKWLDPDAPSNPLPREGEFSQWLDPDTPSSPLPQGGGSSEWLDSDAPSPLVGEGWGEGGERLSSKTRANSPSQPLAGVRIAIARDAAFAFLYRANLELLTALGAEIAFFSPLADSTPPVADALYLPGGYPELHLERLAANETMKAAIRAHHADEKPILAECGGMLYLLESLTDTQGQVAAMAGLMPGQARMGDKLANLGMHEIELPEGSLRGHSFHYSRLETSLTPLALSQGRRGRGGEPAYRLGSLLASYLHLYFPSNSKATARLFVPRLPTFSQASTRGAPVEQSPCPTN